MNERNNSKLTRNAQELRKSMTKEERHLWYDFLKGLSVTFNRQKVMGQYIADFYCDKAKLVIEIDGAQHYEHKALEYDGIRTEYFESLGITVIRFLNKDINKNFENTCMYIDKIVKSKLQ